MNLEVLRISSQSDSTNGILFDTTGGVRKFLCYTLEDEHRDVKVMGETRIPAGTYNIEFRTVGGYHSRELKRYGSPFHKGMLELQDVPNFKYILIHAGNTDEQTAGCILVGDSQTNNDIKTDGFIGSSRNAYKRIYPLIRDELMAGAKVEIEIIDYEEGMTSSSTVTESKHTKVAGGLYCNQCNKTFKTQII